MRRVGSQSSRPHSENPGPARPAGRKNWTTGPTRGNQGANGPVRQGLIRNNSDAEKENEKSKKVRKQTEEEEEVEEMNCAADETL